MLERLIRFWDEEHSLTALLIFLVIKMFILMPMNREGPGMVLASSIIFCLLLLAGMLAMARRPVLQIVSGIFIILLFSVRMARLGFGIPGLEAWDTLFAILSILLMLVVVLWQVYRPGNVNTARVLGAIDAYLLIATIFGFAYAFIYQLHPDAFQMPTRVKVVGVDQFEVFFYYSVVTLTTVGFGDITAIHPMARSLTMGEALIGQLYPAILIARLVTLSASKPTRHDI